MHNIVLEQHRKSCCKPDCCGERNEKGGRRNDLLLKASEQLKKNGEMLESWEIQKLEFI